MQTKSHSITAVKGTWLKRKPKPATELPTDERVICVKGDKYEVSEFERCENDGHWRIVLKHDSLVGDWFIYDVAANEGYGDHWSCSWEQDGPKEESKLAAAATAQAPNEVKLLQAPVPKKIVGMGLSKGMPFNTYITPNITYGEITLYEERRRFTQNYQCKTCVEICEFLEQVRVIFDGKPIKITSGYRPADVNYEVGGAQWSEHLFRAPGMGAIDFYVVGADLWNVQNYCLKNWPYSTGKGYPKGFVHLGKDRGCLSWDY